MEVRRLRLRVHIQRGIHGTVLELIIQLCEELLMAGLYLLHILEQTRYIAETFVVSDLQGAVLINIED